MSLSEQYKCFDLRWECLAYFLFTDLLCHNSQHEIVSCECRSQENSDVTTKEKNLKQASKWGGE